MSTSPASPSSSEKSPIDFGFESDIAEGDHLSKGAVLVLRHQGKLHAVGSRCPHMGYPLSKGTLRDGVLTCAWHMWEFDLDHGGCYRGACDDLPIHPLTIVGGRVLVMPLDDGIDATREATRLREALMAGDPYLQAKALARLLDAQDGNAIVATVLQHGFEHAVSAHRSRQAAIEARAVMDGARLAALVSNERRLPVLLHGIRTVGGPVGERATVTALPHTSSAQTLSTTLERYVTDPSDLAIERLLLDQGLDGAHGDSALLDLATRSWFLDRFETLHALIAALEAASIGSQNRERRAALVAWILGEARGDSDADTKVGQAWYDEHEATLVEQGSGAAPDVDAISAGLDTHQVNTWLDTVAQWQATCGSQALIAAFSGFFARRAERQPPGSGGLVGAAITGMRWARCAKAAWQRGVGPHRRRLPIMLAWHLFRSRWLQNPSAQPSAPTPAQDSYGDTLARNDAPAARAAITTLLRNNPRDLAVWLDPLVDDDLGAGQLDLLVSASELVTAGHPDWPAAVGASINMIVDSRLRHDVRAAARFGRSMR